MQRATIFAAAFCASLLATACNQPDWASRADNALAQANLGSVDAEADQDGRVIHLKGTVPTEADRKRAGEVAQSAVGNNAQIANEVMVAGGDRAMADDPDSGIHTRLTNLVDQDATLKDRRIDFDVVNGVVTIQGTVASADERLRVAELVRTVPGVLDVINALEVRISGTM